MNKKSKEKLLFIVPMHLTMDSFLNPGENSRSYLKKDGKQYNSLSTDLPLGPLSMSAYLKKFIDIDVKVIDFNVELNHVTTFNHKNFYDYCFEFLSKVDFKPSIIGVSSLFSPSFNNFLDCAQASKKIWPNSLVLGGGNIPTNDYEYIYKKLNFNFFDALCYGEGEIPLKELILSENKFEYLESSNSWITKKKIVSNNTFLPKHNFIENLDEIPFFDYDLCDIEKHSINPNITSFHNVMSEGNNFGFHVMTSRGCPYLCTFCASHKTHGRRMRYHSVERVEEDLKKLKEKFGAKTIVFQDDHFMSDKDRVEKILNVVTDLELGSLYQNGLTLYALDRPMLEKFYKAGVRHLVLPVESGSPKVLKENMKKPLKLNISERVAKDCRELGIYTNTNIIIGMPGETKKDIEESRINLRKIKTNWFNIVCASPLVGSEMYEYAKKNNYIKEETKGADYRVATISTEDFSSEYIQKMQYLMNLELNFVFNSDLELLDYDNALKGFENVIKLRADHAFAYYFAAYSYYKINKNKDYEDRKAHYLHFGNSSFWKKWLDLFNLPKDPKDFKFDYLNISKINIKVESLSNSA